MLGAITVVMLLTLMTLLAAGPLMRLIGDKVEAMITRILGVILAALAAQFVIDGLKQSFPHVARPSRPPSTSGTANLAAAAPASASPAPGRAASWT